MVTNSKKSTGEKKVRVKVGKLQLNKETVKNLTDKEVKRIKGGQAAVGAHSVGTKNPFPC